MPDWRSVGQRRQRQAVTLDATGSGTVEFDVHSSNHKWNIDSVILATNQAQTTAPYPTATTYLTGQQVGVSEGASWLGNQDTMSGNAEITSADTFTVAFTGGVTGSVATAIVEGEYFIWR